MRWHFAYPRAVRRNLPGGVRRERDYIITKKPDKKSVWAFNIRESKLQKMAEKYGDFDIVAICDYESPTQKIIRMPYFYLKTNILPKAYKYEDGRYCFEVNKGNLRINWRHKIFMEGQDFLWDRDAVEQEELVRILERQDKKQIVKDLEELTPKTPEVIEYGGRRYKRYNKTIVQLKILRDLKCQMCGKFILKKDGTRYIEAAHITKKRDKGPETHENILILCPNHHKEFDLGKKEIIKRTKDKIIFDLNGKRYEINLKLMVE